MHSLSIFPVAFLITSSLAANHNVTVGPGLTYNPNITTAAVGDTVTFLFYPGGHDVVQGRVSTPCGPKSNGFYSGFIIPESGEADQKFVVTVNNTDPIWYYCSQTKHCQLGMVGVINPPSGRNNTLDSYSAASKNTTTSTAPSVVAGGLLLSNKPSSTPSTTSSKGPSGTSSTPSATKSTSMGSVHEGKNVMLHALSAGVAISAFWWGLV